MFSEFRQFPASVKKELAARIQRLREHGPFLGRPYVDTLKGAWHANMKELRFDVDGGVWRVDFAFDPERSAILLVGGNKIGVSKLRFYTSLIRVAGNRFSEHLVDLCKRRDEGERKR